MAITATFTSDWSQFIKGTKEAESALDQFEKETEAAGGAITKMNTVSDKGAPAAGTLSKEYGKFDSILKTLGISIGPVVGALGELGITATSTVASVGALTVAGGVLAAAITGWQIGRRIAESWGTDEIIGNFTAKMLGWGDVAKETAGAIQDELDRASKAAGRTITNIGEARQIMANLRTENIKAGKDSEKAFDDLQEAIARVNIATQDHAAVLRQMNPALVEAAMNALKHGAAQKDVQAALLLTGSEIAAVTDKIKQETKALEELKKQQDLIDAANKKRGDEMGAIIDEIFGAPAIAAATTWMDVMNTAGVSIDKLTNDQLRALNAAMVAGVDGLIKSGQFTGILADEFGRLTAESQMALNALTPIVTVTEDLAKAQWDYVTALDAELAASIKVRDEAKQKEAEDTARARSGAQAGLLPNAVIGRNGVAMDMFGRPVVAGGGISQLPTVNVNVDGNIIGTEAELARLIGNAMAGNYSKGGNRLPA